MKVLFLDVDGVLNIMSETYYSHSYLTLGSDPIEPHLMMRLEYIMERCPDTKIVISSSWYEKQLLQKLTKVRFKYIDRIIGRTPRDVQPRGNQIKSWLSGKDIESYIVLEDEVSDVCGEKCDTIPIENVIEVNTNEGLSHKNTIDSVIALNNLKEYDRMVNVLSIASYKFYYNKGYRAQVSVPMKDGAIDYDELLNNWDTITIDNNSLRMILSKKIK